MVYRRVADRYFRDTYCLYHKVYNWKQFTTWSSSLWLKLYITSETSVYFNDNRLYCALEDSNVHMRYLENLKFQMM
jgi:hypothetical protein